MISKFLVNKFIKNNSDVEDENVRVSYGYLGGIVGIIINSLLFIIKVVAGLLSGSIAVLADAFNNLSDAASSIITIIGFKLSKAPADKEHPFGHGRIEYISALIVSFMVIIVGFEFIKTSISTILNPKPLKFELIPFILVLVSIGFKLWLSKFNKFMGNRINSTALKAAALDAMGDVFTSSVVVLSLLTPMFTSLPIDGYVGVLVALAILYSGFTLVKDTIGPLIGEAPSPELVKAITEGVLSYDNIIGVHDLIIHNYGPGKCMASIHAEIPASINVMKIHEIIDTAERELSKKLNIYLVIHMDPISVETEEIKETRKEIEKIIKYNPLIKSFHDFRIIGEGDHKNLIFDVVVNPNTLNKIMSEDELKAQIISEMKSIHPDYNCIITIDNDFHEV